MKILNVAEKPSVAKSISKILSTDSRTAKGRNKYCPNIFFNHKDEMIFTSVLGHLFTHDFEVRTRWGESDPYDLFGAGIERRLGSEMESVADNIRFLSRQCGMVVIWTDCDREGENIAMQIKSLVPGKTVKRARFSAISRAEIERALGSLGEINRNESDAVDARIELDLRIGSAFTRLQTLACSRRADEKQGGHVLSFGPCQIPTLNFVVQRHNQILGFVPESFYTLENNVVKKGESHTNCFKWKRGGVFDKNCVLYFHGLLAEGAAVITNKTVEEKERFRPLPLRTVEFQKVCSSYFKIPGHVLMEIAEKLYNNGYISYPRTETDSFAGNFDYQTIIRKLQKDSVLGRYASAFGFRHPRSGKNNDQAHSPIYPLKEGGSLERDERKVYEFIARRFLGCVSENARGVETEYTMSVAHSNGGGCRAEEFRCRGLTVTERNYLDVYIYDKWETTSISGFSIGERVCNSVEVVQGTTSPPEYLTESDLISLMDKNGIGTDATIHEHIHKIQVREYARKERFHFIPNELGINLIGAYNQLELNVSEPTLRKNLEGNLQLVCSGSKDKDQLVRDEIALYRRIYKKFEDGIDLFKRMLGEAGGGAGKENRDNSTKKNGAGARAAKGGAGTGASGPAAGAAGHGTAACDCEKEAKRYTVKKGANSGRAFFTCFSFPKKCTFFKWEDEPDGTGAQGARDGGNGAKRREPHPDPSEDVKCDCGYDPVKKVAHTEANRGREFYCCNKSYKKCKFFKWADE